MSTKGLPGPTLRPPPSVVRTTTPDIARYRRRLATPIRLDADGGLLRQLSFPPRGPAAPTRSRLEPGGNPISRRRRKYSANRSGDDATSAIALSVGIAGNNSLFAQVEKGQHRPTQLPLAYKEPYLLVAKVLASSSQADQVFVQVYGVEDPVDASEPGTWTLIGPADASSQTFDWLEIEINSVRRQTLDELRVGSTWSAVTSPYVVTPAEPPVPMQP